MTNFDVTKALDTAIKAPLWIWFAIMIASSIPMFNIPNLVDTGVDSNFRLGPVPLSLVALTSTALFLSSAVARSWDWLRRKWTPQLEKWSFWLALNRLPDHSKALLYVLEDDGKAWDYIEPDHPSVDPAKDAGFLVAELTADDRAWARIVQTQRYHRLLNQHRGSVRPMLRVDQALRGDVRSSMMRAEQAARRLS